MKHCNDMNCDHRKQDPRTGERYSTCQRHDFCLLEMRSTLTSVVYRMVMARDALNRDERNVEQVIDEMCNWPEIAHAHLIDLALCLRQDSYCCRNDVLGLLEDLAKWLKS